MTVREIGEELLRWIFPPKCVACGRLLARGETYLCASCERDYQSAREQVCPACLEPLSACTCPNRYLERNGVRTVAKLYAYRPQETDLSTNRLIYRLKKVKSEAVIDFLAGELAARLTPMLQDGKQYVLVGVPRSRAAIRKYGGDHVLLLVRALSRKTGISYLRAVKRIGHAGQQKKKNYSARILAADTSYTPVTKYDLHGKQVILVDDIVTSGASLVACARAVRKLGARKVMAAVIGSTFRYADLIGRRRFDEERKARRLSRVKNLRFRFHQKTKAKTQ
ncbi:MAG: phosphoribosyltransferase family protein [Clostridia bacterium]|nr:phosphoribosyltransferase family protein [Clostridia bacterium]MDY6184305.1 phosphoribosyltransferase family protein [Eubacteriales bacterium]